MKQKDSIKVCTACRCEFPESLEYFPPNKGCKNGLEPTCRICHRAYMREWKRANSEKLAERRRELYALKNGPIQREQERIRKNEYPLRCRASLLRSGMVGRSKERSLDFDSDVFTVKYLMKWIAETPNCPCCGREIDYGFKHDNTKHDNSPSIDRIIPARGYVVGNVALICWRCNNLKRDASIEELEAVVNWMRSKGCLPKRKGKSEASDEPASI